MKLYHYVHCPFCVRVRMVMGALKLKYESVVLPYDDEETPIRLTRTKMLPIVEFENVLLNESLDIIAKLDKDEFLDSSRVINSYHEDLEPILNEIGSNVHSLAMPYWIWTPEFNDRSRSYFQRKKEKKRGPFNLLVQNQRKFLDGLNKDLEKYSNKFDKDLTNSKIDLSDILIAAHLWGMYVVPEFQFPLKVHSYLQEVKRQTNFDYHKDFWI